MDFVALDMETANADLASICQIGIVCFCGEAVRESWKSLVNPEDYFDPFNVRIHRITEDSVKDAPVFPQVCDTVREFLTDRVVVTHTGFDRVALSRVADKYGLDLIQCVWLDTAMVARRAWQEFSYSGYGLANVANRLSIDFAHHDAQEDAWAAGQVLLRAMQETGMTVAEWLDRVRKPINPVKSPSESSLRVAVDSNPEGPLFGEVIVFTGKLTMVRDEAAEIAARIGCRVAPGVTKETTLLVVGDQDIAKLAGHEKSSKHRKAEALISEGQRIRIIQERDFLNLVATVQFC